MSLEKNQLIYFINYFLLKSFNVNLFMCLHLEKDLSRVLRSEPGSIFTIASFSVNHRSHFLALFVYESVLEAIDHLRS